MQTIIFSVASLGLMALIFGAALGYAGMKFKTEEDPRLAEMRRFIPGSNCGGCGFSGCEAWMRAVYSGDAKPEACAVISDESLDGIGKAAGIAVTPIERKRAHVMCAGNNSNSVFKYIYNGMDDCAAIARLAGGGPKSCGHGCLGGRSCADACRFGAVTIKDGIAVIDGGKCTACGACVKKCPKKIIGLVDKKSFVVVACSSRVGGKALSRICEAGCTGCGLCVRTCVRGAIKVENNLASINNELCDGCGECMKRCPTDAIKSPGDINQ